MLYHWAILPSVGNFERRKCHKVYVKGKVLQKSKTPPGGLEPPTFRLTAERASLLRHGGRWLVWLYQKQFLFLRTNIFNSNEQNCDLREHPGSNQGPLDLQSNALPLSYTPIHWKLWVAKMSQSIYKRESITKIKDAPGWARTFRLTPTFRQLVALSSNFFFLRTNRTRSWTSICSATEETLSGDDWYGSIIAPSNFFFFPAYKHIQ